MSKLKKYQYTLKTLSKVIVSPRDHAGFYLAMKDFSTAAIGINDNFGDRDKINIIYPFYQYSTYSCYQPQNASYYIPGSTVKGAIKNNDKNSSLRMMVDDLPISQDALCLDNLWKVQYISYMENKMEKENNKEIKFERFFPNVAVEMLNSDKHCEGEMFLENEPKSDLANAQENTKIKLDQLRRRIDLILQDFSDDVSNNENSRSVLEKTRENIKQLNDKNDPYLLLIGGYKGLLLSGIFKERFIESAIYIDKATYLPYGLVRIKFK